MFALTGVGVLSDEYNEERGEEPESEFSNRSWNLFWVRVKVRKDGQNPRYKSYWGSRMSGIGVLESDVGGFPK